MEFSVISLASLTHFKMIIFGRFFFLSIFVLAAVGRQRGGSPGKAQPMCLCAGRDGCRMTSAYHCTADHFLAGEGRAAGSGTKGSAAPPALRGDTATSWAGAEPGTPRTAFTKGQAQAETVRAPGKGRSFPALPECHISTVSGAEEPAAFAFPSSRCLLGLSHVADGAEQLSITPSLKLVLC